MPSHKAALPLYGVIRTDNKHAHRDKVHNHIGRPLGTFAVPASCYNIIHGLCRAHFGELGAFGGGRVVLVVLRKSKALERLLEPGQCHQ